MSAEPFDPYLKWLGIPKKHQPPHLYRLLGIQQFESDPDVIANAADQRMVHLRNLAGGKHGDLSQKLLNEVSSARVTLLNAERKAAYDAQLRQRRESKRASVWQADESDLRAATPLTSAPPLPTERPAAQGGINLEGPSAARDSTASSLNHLHKQRPIWIWGAALGGGALAGVLVLWLVLGSSKEEDSGSEPSAIARAMQTNEAGSSSGQADDLPTLPVEDPSSRRSGQDAGADPKEVPQDTVDEPSNPNFKPPSFAPSETPPTQPKRPPIQSYGSGGTPPPDGDPDPDRSGEESLGQVGAIRPADSGSRTTHRPTTEPAADARLPVPDEEARRKAKAEIEEIFRDKIEMAKTTPQIAALAQDLAREGSHRQNPPASRYVLLTMARDLMAKTGNVDGTLALGKELGEAFEVSRFGAQADALEEVAEAVIRNPRTPIPLSQRIIDVALQLGDQALSAADIEAAARLARLAIPAARKIRNPKLLGEVQQLSEEMEDLQARLPLVEMARQRIQVEPENPKANLVAGQWDCFVAGQWERGFPQLVKGSDEDLASLAARDLADPATAAEQVDLAEAYWELSERLAGIESKRARQRAVEWFQLASKQAPTELLQARIDRRLRDAIAEAGTEEIDYALEFDGQTSHAVVANFAYPGTRPITIEAIVKPYRLNGSFRSSSSSRQTIFGNLYRGGVGLGLYSSYYWEFRFYYSSGSSYPYEDAARGYPGNSITARNVNPKTWHHVAGVYNVRQAQLFLDGKLLDTEAGNGLHFIGQLPFVIGGDPSATGGVENFYRGQIRAIRVSNTIRYTQDFEPPDTLAADASTVLLFPINEGKGTKLQSTVGRRIFAQINNAKWVPVEP